VTKVVSKIGMKSTRIGTASTGKRLLDLPPLKLISAELASPDYGRVRVGIGRPPAHFQGDVADFVLQAFALEERSELTRVLASTCGAIESVISDGLDRTMNRTNQRMVR